MKRLPRIPESDHILGETYPGAGYDAEQELFIKAMERFKRKNRRPFPACTEVLAVLKSLGYRRVADPEKYPPETLP